MATTPEASEHTSVKARVDHCRAQGRLDDLQAAREGSVAGVKQARGIENGLRLSPIGDRRCEGIERAGLLEGFSIGSYLQLVDYTSRLVRHGKARAGRQVASIFERLGTRVGADDHTLVLAYESSGSYVCVRSGETMQGSHPSRLSPPRQLERLSQRVVSRRSICPYTLPHSESLCARGHRVDSLRLSIQVTASIRSLSHRFCRSLYRHVSFVAQESGNFIACP